jgi:hypothetical protein
MTRLYRRPTRSRHHLAAARATALAPALVAAAALAISACSFTTEPEHAPGIGVISQSGQAYVSLPDSAVAGQDFTIYILTFGGCMTHDHTRVEYSAPRSAVVTPWNRRTSASCPEIGGTVEHTATLRFDTPGEAHVAVRDGSTGGLGIAHFYLHVH